jgi:hypothetical protein
VWRHEDVVRLDVAVHESGLVGLVQPARRQADDADRLVLRHLAGALNPLPERLAFDELHDHVGRGAFVAEVESADDVDMVQAAGRRVFLLEALDQDAIAGQVRRQDLDRDRVRALTMARLVDRAHAAFGDLVQKIVGADSLRLGIHRHYEVSRRARPEG